MRRHEFGAILTACLLAGLIGCSGGPKRISLPTIPSDASQVAMEQYDLNHDGTVAAEELDGAPSLRASLAQIDLNRDSKIDAAEIDARIAAWRDSRVGLIPMTIRVSFRSQPLSNAEVTIIPEAFLGEGLKPARGVTNQDGVAVMQISKEPHERGVQSGFYRVQISKKNGETESLPTRYNSTSQLGIEVEPTSPSSRDVSFALLP